MTESAGEKRPIPIASKRVRVLKEETPIPSRRMRDRVYGSRLTQSVDAFDQSAPQFELPDTAKAKDLTAGQMDVVDKVNAEVDTIVGRTAKQSRKK